MDSRTTDGRTEAAVQRDNLTGSQLRQFARRVIECGSKDRADSVPSVRDCGGNEMSSETDMDGDSRRLNGDDNDKYNDNDSEEKHDSDRSLDNVWKQLRQISRSKKKYIPVTVCVNSKRMNAIPLSNIWAQTIADALMTQFCQTGLPKVVRVDAGSHSSRH